MGGRGDQALAITPDGTIDSIMVSFIIDMLRKSSNRAFVLLTLKLFYSITN